MSDSHAPDIVKWYTRARKFPQLIGRTPDGMKLWGGPYTITQAVGLGLTLFVGLNTMGLWANFGFLGNFVVLGGVGAGVVFGLGRIPVGSRNPLSVVNGAYKAVASPPHGHLGGKVLRLRRPHRLHHTVIMQRVASPTSAQLAMTATDVVAPRTSSRSRTWFRRSPTDTAVPTLTGLTPPPAPLPAVSDIPTVPASTTVSAPALTGIQTLLAAVRSPAEAPR